MSDDISLSYASTTSGLAGVNSSWSESGDGERARFGDVGGDLELELASDELDIVVL